jgi:hypothetical protein
VRADRSAASHNPTARLTGKGTAELFKLHGSPHWWPPVRNRLVKSSGGDPAAPSGNVITYVSRHVGGKGVEKGRS